MTTTYLHRRHSSQQSASSIPKVAAPSHRHAAPSGPWPFLNLSDQVDKAQITPANSPLLNNEGFAEQQGSLGGQVLRLSSDWTADTLYESEDQNPELSDPTLRRSQGWKAYPQSHFPNWTLAQQARSGIRKAIRQDHPTSVYRADVLTSGQFRVQDPLDITKQDESREHFWETTNQPRPKDTILRAYFVEDLSGPALQMLGSRFHIEPFFFSSFLKWIPSRHYQDQSEDPDAPSGEHMTVTLAFIRSTKRNEDDFQVGPVKKHRHASAESAIDIQAPLLLDSRDRLLVHDFLSLHLIRVKPTPGVDPDGQADSSTLISLHPTSAHRATSASQLHGRFLAVGRSVYWSNMLAGRAIPTTTKLPAHSGLDSSILPDAGLSSTSGMGLFRRRSSGASGHVRRHSSDASRRRNSRSDSIGLGLTFDVPTSIASGTIAHRRKSSLGSMAFPSMNTGLWLEDVDEDAVAEDDEEEQDKVHMRGMRRESPSAISEGSSPPHTPPAQSGFSTGQHLSVSPNPESNGRRSPSPRSRRLSPSTPNQEPQHSSPRPLHSSPKGGFLSDSPNLMGDSPLPAVRDVPMDTSPSEMDVGAAADPALIMLSMLWHALYCWDEVFEDLAYHVGSLESRTLAISSGMTRNGRPLDPEMISQMHTSQSQELFIIQAHLLHYASLLADFRKSVGFVEGAALGTGGESLNYVTRMNNRKRGDSMGYGPGGQRKKRQDTYSKFGGDADDDEIFGGLDYGSPASFNEARREEEASNESFQEQYRKRTMRSESAKMVDEIERLERQRAGLENRLKNLMNLAYSRINIEDSKAMQKLTEASLRDSAAMKQVSYISTIFLPATFAAALFGMNVGNLKPGTTQTLAHYFETVLPLSAVSIWLIVAMQFAYKKRYSTRRNADGTEIRRRELVYDVVGSLSWPVMLLKEWMIMLDPTHRLEKVFDAASIRSRRSQARSDPWDTTAEVTRRS